MSLQPPFPDSHPPAPPPPPPRQGLSLAAGAALGVLIGLVGPVILALMAWMAQRLLPMDVAESLITLSIAAILVLPVILLVAGCLLMIPDRARGWGVAGLMASGVWLISSAGVCTVFLVGVLAIYDNSAMMLL